MCDHQSLYFMYFRFDPGLLQLVTRRALRIAAAVSKATVAERQRLALGQEDVESHSEEAWEDQRAVSRGVVALLAATVNSPK